MFKLNSFCKECFVRPRRRSPLLDDDSNSLHVVCDGSSGNDPSAGSPTETLLRLHLPLNDKV